MLNILFKNVPYAELVENFAYTDDSKLVPYDKLTPEVALYWKTLAKFLLKEGEILY